MTIERKAYSTPEDVFSLLGMMDYDSVEPMTPNNTTYPSYDWLVRMLKTASAEFDASVHDTWGENQITDYIFDRGTEWSLNNMSYFYVPYSRGGWATQLLGPIRTWDKEKGDKLEIRNYSNGDWIDITDEEGKSYWFDYRSGVFYYLNYYAPIHNSFRITYRYGRSEEPPMDVQNAVCMQVGIWLMQTDWYRTKMGGGGDLSSKSETIRSWEKTIAETKVRHFRCGEAISLLP